jgi:hypothetical protein
LTNTACEILGLALRTLERWEKESGLIDKRATADLATIKLTN